MSEIDKEEIKAINNFGQHLMKAFNHPSVVYGPPQPPGFITPTERDEINEFARRLRNAYGLEA